MITVTCYYGNKNSSGINRYPLRMDFEVLRWPSETSNLRCFAYGFTTHWLDGLLLPLQPPEMRWSKMTLRLPNGQYYQIPLMGKYGSFEGSQISNRIFEVHLIPSHSAKIAKVFRLRGVADAYQLFDRPGSSNPDILQRALLLEKALVSPITYLSAEGDLEEEGFVLRYVKIPFRRERLSRGIPRRDIRHPPSISLPLSVWGFSREEERIVKNTG